MSFEPLKQTSVQLPASTLNILSTWPGLSQSESIRLAVDRAIYLGTLNSEEVAAIADRYRSLLIPALEDFDFDDYRTVARALPAIVQGFLSETPNVSFRDPGGDDLNEGEVIEKLRALDANERIGVLDYIVALRQVNDASIETVANALPSGRPFVAEGVEFPHGTIFRKRYRDREYTAQVRDGALVYDGREYPSLSAAAIAVTGGNVNGWRFWQVCFPGQDTWMKADDLR